MFICDEGRFVLRTSPKVLSTALGYFFFNLENSSNFVPVVANGRTYRIHHFYPIKPGLRTPTLRGFKKIALVRDPLTRFRAVFSDRVEKVSPATEWSWRQAELAGLKRNPDIATFIARLGDYIDLCPDINHHIKPQYDFLNSARHFDHIFSSSRVSELEEFMSERLGRPVTLPHMHRSRSSEVSLTENQEAVVRDYYWKDYKEYDEFF
jgi:hypothetical protein